MSSATADSLPESVGSCPPTPPTATPPPLPPATVPSAPRLAPVRRQLDFADAGVGAGAGPSADGDLENVDEEFLRAVDDIERGYSEAKAKQRVSEAKRRAPPCVCGRGVCAVWRDEQRGRLMYVCSSQPKCKHVALCEEFNLCPESEPAAMNPPKPRNSSVLNIPGNHVPEPRTLINNITLQGAGATTSINVSPQAVVCTTPLHVSPQVAGTAAAVKLSPLGRRARSNDEWPNCKCTAGKCKVLRKNGVDHYVCPIPKGQGACTHEVPVHAHAVAVANELLETGDGYTRGDKDLIDKAFEKEAHRNNLVRVGGNNANGLVNPVHAEDNEWPFDVVNGDIVPTPRATPHAVLQGSPSMLRQPITTMKTPTQSPMTPYSTCSPMTPCLDNICYGSGGKGHWSQDCPKPSPKEGCYRCGMVGHWMRNCPKLRRS